VPVVNPSTDNWSRSPSVTLSQAFTAWAANGEWAAQLLQFITPKTLSYIALAVTGKTILMRSMWHSTSSDAAGS
jgi:hypothetical protein